LTFSGSSKISDVITVWPTLWSKQHCWPLSQVATCNLCMRFSKRIEFLKYITFLLLFLAHMHGCHLVFLKMFAKNKMTSPFWMLKKILYLNTCYGRKWAKRAVFYDILTLNLGHLIFFFFFLKKIWLLFGLFSILSIWPF